MIGGPPSVPFALGYGLTVIFPARFGSAAVLEPDKSVEASLAAIERYGVTLFAAVVSYYRLMAAALDGRSLGSLRRSMTGGEPLLPETESLWREASGMVLEQFIGTTETFHCFVSSSDPGRPARSGTLGRAAPGYEVSVLDAEILAPVADGERGLMAVRGCTGTVYWRNEERQRELVRDGWNVFPDVVIRDAEGYFRYVGRHDDMIVSAGYNISPIEVETALLRHEAVLECACVPAPDPVRRAGRDRQGLRRRRPRPRGRREPRRSAPGPRQGDRAALHVSARNRLPGRPAEDRQRQGPAVRTARPGRGRRIGTPRRSPANSAQPPDRGSNPAVRGSPSAAVAARPTDSCGRNRRTTRGAGAASVPASRRSSICAGCGR